MKRLMTVVAMVAILNLVALAGLIASAAEPSADVEAF